jgi:hypothetical protein
MSLLPLLLQLASPASAFCGFYVAKADTQLYNEASKVVLVREGDETTVTMASDYQGDPREFALVVPVPSVIQKHDVSVVDAKIIDHLDAYSAPRLVEYTDPDPCAPAYHDEDDYRSVGVASRAAPAESKAAFDRARALGVKIEATYTVGEYDILVLGATQSAGLTQWLTEEGYRLPDGAEPVIGSYLKQNMKFFVAKVNLGEKARAGVQDLRPIRVHFRTSKFMLPIRLGTVNSKGKQEMFVFGITPSGRIETTNYPNVPLPTGQNIPQFVRKDFGSFYKAMFNQLARGKARSGLVQEYSWNMGSCDPCSAEPLSGDELRSLGADWVSPGGWANAHLTRLHVRYDGEAFPDDLQFQVTGDQGSFQGRYVLQNEVKGATCSAATAYYAQVRERQEKEAVTLAGLTGWSQSDIRRRMGLAAVNGGGDAGFWDWFADPTVWWSPANWWE